MARNKRSHGVVTPNKRRNVPGRVVNVRSRRSVQNNVIRLDKLLKNSCPRILIKRRLGGIGDVIMTTPIMKHLKRLMPHCYITYATDTTYAAGALKEVIEHNPYTDEVVRFGATIEEGDYDYSVDITSTGLSRERSGSIPPNRIDMFAEEVGVDVSSDPVPDYIVTKEETQWADKEILKYVPEGKELKDCKFIGIQCRSNDARRTWPQNNIVPLAENLTKDPNVVVFLYEWGKEVKNWEDGERIWAIKDLPLTKLAAMFEKIDVVVCPDSAALHLAGALNKKIVTIFGPIPPQSRINYYANATAVVHVLPCSFCWYAPKCTGSETTKLECIRKITVEEVADAVKKKLKEQTKVMSNIIQGKELTSSNQDPAILIKRAHGGLGDILMASTAIKGLKKKYPNKKIHLSIPKEYHPLYENNHDVSELLDYQQPVNLKRYYMIIDISTPDSRYECARYQAKKRIEKNRVEIYAEAMRVRNYIEGITPYYYVTKEENEWAKEWINKQTDKKKPTLCFALNSAELYRDWPNKYQKELFSALSSKINIILLGMKREEFYENTIDARALGIRKIGALINNSDGLVSVDTGPLHIAAALEIPTIALFGPIDYRTRCKGYKNVIAVTADLDCIPCWRNCNIKCKKKNSAKGHSVCMEKISPKNVISIIMKKLIRRTNEKT